MLRQVAEEFEQTRFFSAAHAAGVNSSACRRALLQFQLAVLADLAQLVHHCHSNLANHQAACSKQVGAFKASAVDVLHTCIHHESENQYRHEQHARCTNDGVEEVFHFGIPFLFRCCEIRAFALTLQTCVVLAWFALCTVVHLLSIDRVSILQSDCSKFYKFLLNKYKKYQWVCVQGAISVMRFFASYEKGQPCCLQVLPR